jgi:predicted nucleic acid-binding protein
VSEFIVDASVAVKWFVVESHSEQADELSLGRYRLYAPRIIVTEVANALSRKTMAGLMSVDEACHYLPSLRSFFDSIVEIDDMIEPALINACELRHPIYDLIYLETARRMNDQMITADRRFTSKLAGSDLARHVTLLSDWQPA